VPHTKGKTITMPQTIKGKQMSEKMAFGPYLKKIEEICRPLSREELQEIIMSLAREARVHERNSFIEKLEACLPGVQRKQNSALLDEDVFDGIEALKESILERIELIEDGEYQELEDFDDYGSFDDEPEEVSEEQMYELESYFDDAGQYFLNGKLETVRKIYEALFALIEETEIKHLLFDMNILEDRARYCRCIYELTAGPHRVDAFLKAMNPDFEDSTLTSSKDDYPTLNDVIDTLAEPLPDFEIFLPEWEAVLSQPGIPGFRRARLWLEAVSFRNDFERISELAREWGDQQPYGYIFWLEQLKQRKSWKETAKVSKEALSIISPGRQREKIAGHLIQAGEQLDDKDLVLEGKREFFFSAPAYSTLVVFINEAEKSNLRQQELDKAVDYLNTAEKLFHSQEDLYITALTMAGRIKETFANSANVEAVGWSYNSSSGLLFSSALYLYSRMNEECSVTRTLMEDYAGRYFFEIFDYDFSGQYDLEGECLRQVMQGLAMSQLSDAELNKYFQWALKLGESRIKHIVSNKYRKAYGRAAKVLVAMAEAYAANDDNKKAVSMLKKYYYELFNRFSAFRSEVRVVLETSEILKKKSIGV
jgi:hypothetical protein